MCKTNLDQLVPVLHLGFNFLTLNLFETELIFMKLDLEKWIYFSHWIFVKFMIDFIGL